jgi:hypothetical protein
VITEEVAKAVAEREFRKADDLMTDSSEEELRRLWDDARWTQDRARYYLASRFRVVMR